MNNKKLEKRERDLLQTLESIQEAAAPVDLKSPVGRLSRMDLMQQQQVALANKKKLENALKLVQAAKKRLESGEYGICLACEEDISESRLNAFPEAPFCINCTDR